MKMFLYASAVVQPTALQWSINSVTRCTRCYTAPRLSTRTFVWVHRRRWTGRVLVHPVPVDVVALCKAATCGRRLQADRPHLLKGALTVAGLALEAAESHAGVFVSAIASMASVAESQVSVEVADTEGPVLCAFTVRGCGCDIDTDCSVYGDASDEACCGTGQGFCGEYSGDGWIDICHNSDVFRLPSGCGIALATESGGGGSTYTYDSSVCMGEVPPGWDTARSVRLFRHADAAHGPTLAVSFVVTTDSFHAALAPAETFEDMSPSEMDTSFSRPWLRPRARRGRSRRLSRFWSPRLPLKSNQHRRRLQRSFSAANTKRTLTAARHSRGAKSRGASALAAARATGRRVRPLGRRSHAVQPWPSSAPSVPTSVPTDGQSDRDLHHIPRQRGQVLERPRRRSQRLLRVRRARERRQADLRLGRWGEGDKLYLSYEASCGDDGTWFLSRTRAGRRLEGAGSDDGVLADTWRLTPAVQTGAMGGRWTVREFHVYEDTPRLDPLRLTRSSLTFVLEEFCG